jgi:PatG C-terminal
MPHNLPESEFNEDKVSVMRNESSFNDKDKSNDTLQVSPQDNTEKSCGCASKGGTSIEKSISRSFIYAIGNLEPRFPSPAVEKEYLQAIGRSETKGQTNYEAMRTALLKRENRYLVRQICWILKIEGLETYIITPRDPADFEMLADSLRSQPRGTDIDVVVGVRGPVAQPEMCNGLMVPIVFMDQIYSFDTDSLVKAIPRPEKTDAKRFAATAEEVLARVMQMSDNVGATDEHRALNYLSVRYDAIYANSAEMHERNFQLDGVEVRPSRLSGVRKIVDVIFAYRNRSTDVVEKYFTRVDITEEFPYLISKLSPYYDR